MMPGRYHEIGDYGLISDMNTCALVSREGSVDWLCLPSFDSPSVFARILDANRGGCFQIAPRGIERISRRYLPDTNVLETTFVTDSGEATLTDFMPPDTEQSAREPANPDFYSQINRILECTKGRIDFFIECMPRFEYGLIVPHAVVTSPHYGFAHGGAGAISLFSTAPLVESEDGFAAKGTLSAGERIHASLSRRSGFSHAPVHHDPQAIEHQLETTVAFWREWASRCTYEGEFRDDVVRSALTLKALTYRPSGAMVAAPTTSLPEEIGGIRNWDYRYTWIRDASFSLYALFLLGYHDEARAFKDWLEWSTVGRARDLQIMYGIDGRRRLQETNLPGLEGYRGSAPVLVGNFAYTQFQLDVYGELMDSAHLYRKFGGEMDRQYWAYLKRVVSYVIDHWREPDDGIWESRGGRRHFVFSKVMCWVALDRAIKAARALGLDGDIERWVAARAEIRRDVMLRGFDEKRGVFLQAYDSDLMDAANLMLPLVGFIKASDPRMTATIRAVEDHLTAPNGFVYRYRGFDDGLSGNEGTFLMCTFWLADNLLLLGETQRARVLFETVRRHANDLGLYSEQVDPDTGALLGNFPQAFSHLGHINTAVHLARATAPGRVEGK
jgi:GH15 family glucan-1,4-alpha-glucosidase